MKPKQPIDLEQAVLTIATTFAREVTQTMRADIADRVARALELARVTMLAELDEPSEDPALRIGATRVIDPELIGNEDEPVTGLSALERRERALLDPKSKRRSSSAKDRFAAIEAAHRKRAAEAK